MSVSFRNASSGDPITAIQFEREPLNDSTIGRADTIDNRVIADRAKAFAENKNIPQTSIEEIQDWDESAKAVLLAYFLSYCNEDGKDNNINKTDDEAQCDKDRGSDIFHSALNVCLIDQQKGCFMQLWQAWKGSECEDAEEVSTIMIAEAAFLYKYLQENDISQFANHLHQLSELLGANVIQDLLLEDFTLLQFACRYGKVDFAEHLIRLGFDINYTPVNHRKPIQLACKNGHPEILRLLIANNALTEDQPFIKSSKGRTLFHQAVWNFDSPENSAKCLEILINLANNRPKIECIGQVNDQDDHGRTPLHYAVMRKNEACILLLLRNGAHIDAKDDFKQMPLSSMPDTTLQEYFDSMISLNSYNKSELQRKSIEPHDLQFDFRDMFQKEENQEYSFEMDLLKKMKREKRLKNIIGHPIISIIIHFQWYRIRLFFYSYIAFYVLFTGFYTAYVISEGMPKNSTNETTMLIREKSKSEDCTTIIFFILSTIILTGFSILELVKLCGRKTYFTSLDNLIRIATFSLAWAVLLIDRINDNEFTRLKAISILMVWFEFFLVLSKYPPLTYHIITFRTASLKLIKFLIFHSVILIGFAFSFHILFRKSKDKKAEIFQKFLNTTFKTIIMLTSEFDASDIPFDEYEGVSHIIFILYIFFITIVLFNLMIALALSRVNDMEKNRVLYRSFTEIDMIVHIEDYYLEGHNKVHKAIQRCVYEFGMFFRNLYKKCFKNEKRIVIKEPILRLKGNELQQWIKFETYPKRRVRFIKKEKSAGSKCSKGIFKLCRSFFSDELDYNVVNKAWEIATKNKIKQTNINEKNP